MNLPFELISKKLLHRKSRIAPQFANMTRAAVAMILYQCADELEILLIQRAAHDQDPWSGHIAFPGGKLKQGESECQAARRETLEEIGIELADAQYMGRLSDIVGSNLPVRVSCCLFGVDKFKICPELNEEVSELFWVKLADLNNPLNHIQSRVSFDQKNIEVPAIRLPLDDKPVLWGITYRLVMQFLNLLD
jgi:8-oxo-dGTP pyrophosphatase MutT (NUDIX family)